MPASIDAASADRDVCFLWVDLTQEGTALLLPLGGARDLPRVREPALIRGAIEFYAPMYLCFEFDEPDAPGIAALARTRHEHPSLPVLMITGGDSVAVVIWALRIRVWDLLVKPVSIGELRQSIAALTELTRRHGETPARQILFPQQDSNALFTSYRRGREGRTYPAISHVAAQFVDKIALDYVADLCRLSTSQFCRVFRHEHGVSFAQYLLRYRIERACERLGHRGALAKEVAYAVGFNDLSYFTRAFKRQVGVCPSRYQAYQAGA